MIHTSYKQYQQIQSFMDTGDFAEVIQRSLRFLRQVAQDYIRMEIFNQQRYDGDDFFTSDVAKLLAQAVRQPQTPVELVQEAQRQIAEIEGMEAYQFYYLCSFDLVREALHFRLSDADAYLAELDKQLARYIRSYQNDIQGGNLEFVLSINRFEKLGELLVKKVEYLAAHGQADALTGMLADFPYVPALQTYYIRQLMAQGRDSEALAAIDAAILPYGSDSYYHTEEWHLMKISLLEKRQDRVGIIQEYRQLFRQFLTEKRPYFEKLKSLVPAAEWDDFIVALFQDIPYVNEDDCITICDLIVEEKKYGCLLTILLQTVKSFERVELYQKYVSYMSDEDQATFTQAVIEDLRFRLSYAKSKSYGYIVDDIKGMYATCPTSKKLMASFVDEIVENYGNRPALMRLLR